MGLASSTRLRTALVLAAGLLVSGVAAGLHSTPAPRPVAGPVPVAASAADGSQTPPQVTLLTGQQSAPDPLGAGLPRIAAPAATAAIRPGTVTETAGAGLCTSSFVFTSGSRVLLGQAAHCAGTGADTETDGCTSSTLPLGTPVTVRADREQVTGTLVYSSWITMQQHGERDRDACAYNDFALVELPARAADLTNPSLPFFGGPAGVRDTALADGDPVFGLANPEGADGRRVLRPRAGTAGDEVGGGWGHTVYTATTGVAGESGSPLLDEQGRAVGLLSSLNVGGQRSSIEFTDLARAIGYARDAGGLDDLSLSGGTEPFGATPTELSTPAGPPVAAGS